jgi:hypothetical protein
MSTGEDDVDIEEDSDQEVQPLTTAALANYDRVNDWIVKTVCGHA